MVAAAERLAGATSGAGRLLAALARVRPLYVVSVFVVIEWLVTLVLALTIRHNGWLFYHGGDQTFYYTTSYALLHGQLIPTSVGYGWSTILLPFALLAGPDLLNALPAIILLNVIVLMPIAMAATYGIAERIAGRLFGYWTLFLWIVIPLVGMKYVDAGFKARFTEQGLPDSLGLTALSDFPQMVAVVAAAYFTIRALQRPAWADGVLAGLLTGCAIGIKPSAALYLGGVGLATIGCRRWRLIPSFAAGLAPALLALGVWKWRGLGYLPIFHAEHAVRLAAGPALPLAGLNLHQYLSLNWGEFGHNLGSLREHFWSERVIEWIVLAGVLALVRRSLPAFLLIGGWFFAFVIIKGTGPFGTLEDGSLLHKLIPVIPAFVLIVAAVPLLLPRLPQRIPRTPEPLPWASRRATGVLIAVLLACFTIAPIAFAGAAHLTNQYGQGDTGPVPLSGFPLGLTAHKGSVHLTWPAQRPWGARPYYLVLRGALGLCGAPLPVFQDTCFFAVAGTHNNSYVDKPPRDHWQQYYIVVGANWLNDTVNGEDYLVSEGASYEPH